MPINNLETGNDLLALICAGDAFVLRRHITDLLWTSIEEKVGLSDPSRIFHRNAPDNGIFWLSPKGFKHYLPDLIKEDAQALQASWRALNHSQQNKEYEWWTKGFNPDAIGNSFKRDLTENLLLYDEKLRDIGSRVVRISYLADRIEAFWRACCQYYEDSSRKPENREKLLEQWAKLFAVVVAPVTLQKGNYHLHTLFPHPPLPQNLWVDG